MVTRVGRGGTRAALALLFASISCSDRPGDAPDPAGSAGPDGGAVGYIGFDGNMDVAIAIRTIVAHKDEMWLQAGAGIVEASDPDREYEETVNKARAGLVAVKAGAP